MFDSKMHDVHAQMVFSHDRLKHDEAFAADFSLPVSIYMQPSAKSGSPFATYREPESIAAHTALGRTTVANATESKLLLRMTSSRHRRTFQV